MEAAGVNLYCLPASVGVVESDGGPQSDLYVAHLPDGPIVVVSGVAAALYRAVAAGEELIPTLAASLEVPETDIDTEAVAELLDWFMSEGLLERR